MKRENELIPSPKPKQRRVRKDDAELREVIAPLQYTHTQGQMSKIATEKMGKSVSKLRISAMLHRMKDERSGEFNDVFLSSRKAAEQSYHVYRRLGEEGWKLLSQAQEIESMILKMDDEGSKVEAKKSVIQLSSMAHDKIRQAQESMDKLMKMAGVHRESAPKDNEEQIQDLLKAMNIYLKYVVKCGKCEHIGSDVQQFIEFIEMVGKDPSALDAFMKEGTGVSKYAGVDEKYYTEANRILEEDGIIDV